MNLDCPSTPRLNKLTLTHSLQSNNTQNSKKKAFQQKASAAKSKFPACVYQLTAVTCLKRHAEAGSKQVGSFKS